MLSDRDILREMYTGKIVIEPFDRTHLGANSYDVTLGRFFFIVEWNDYGPVYRGPMELAPREKVSIPVNGTLLGMTEEVIGTVGNVVAYLRARSTIGRMGITVCRDAGLGDVGYHNHWTVELTAQVTHGRPWLRVGDRFAQVVFEYTDSPPINPYSGQYKRDDWPLCMVPAAFRGGIYRR